MRVQVLTDTKKKEGVARGSGRPYSFRMQAALIQLGHETRQFWLEVRGDDPFYAPGDYEFQPTVRVNQYGELELGRAYTMTPVKASARAAA